MCYNKTRGKKKEGGLLIGKAKTTDYNTNTYTVVINLNGGSATAPTVTTGTVTTISSGYRIAGVKYTELIKLFDPSKLNYVFAGWELQATGDSAKIDGVLLTSIDAGKYDPTNGIYYNTAEDYITAQYLRSIDGDIVFIAHYNDIEMNVSIEGAIEFVYNESGDPDGVYKLSTLVDNDELNTLYQSISMSQSGYTGTGVSIAHDLTIKMLTLSGYTFDGWYYVTWNGTQSSVFSQITDITFDVDSVVENGLTYSTYTIPGSDLAELNASGHTNIVICPKWTANIYTISIHTLVRYASSTNATLHISNPYAGTLTVDGISGTVSFNTWLYSDKGIAGITLSNQDSFAWKYGNVVQSQSDASLFTLKVGRTGTVTLDPIAATGYTFIGYSSTSHSGTTTNVSATGSYGVTNITADSSIYYYFEANNYNLTVDYGFGTWVENGAIKEHTRIISGLIVDVVYNQSTILGDPYRMGYMPIGLVSAGTSEDIEQMCSNDYNYFYTNPSGEIVEYYDNTFRYTSSVYTSQNYTTEVMWALVPIWINYFDNSGNILANGTNVGTVDTPVYINRYQFDLTNLTTGILGTIVSKCEIYLVKHDNPLTVDIETNYNMINNFTISAGQDVTIKSLEIVGETATQVEKVINMSGQIVLNGGTLTLGGNIKINTYNNNSIFDVNSGTLNLATDVVQYTETNDQGTITTTVTNITKTLSGDVVGVTIDGTNWSAVSNETTPVYMVDIASGAIANITGVTFTNITVGNGVVYSAGTTTFTDCSFVDNTVTNITLEEATS